MTYRSDMSTPIEYQITLLDHVALALLPSVFSAAEKANEQYCALSSDRRVTKSEIAEIAYSVAEAFLEEKKKRDAK